MALIDTGIRVTLGMVGQCMAFYFSRVLEQSHSLSQLVKRDSESSEPFYVPSLLRDTVESTVCKDNKQPVH